MIHRIPTTYQINQCFLASSGLWCLERPTFLLVPLHTLTVIFDSREATQKLQTCVLTIFVTMANPRTKGEYFCDEFSCASKQSAWSHDEFANGTEYTTLEQSLQCKIYGVSVVTFFFGEMIGRGPICSGCHTTLEIFIVWVLANNDGSEIDSSWQTAAVQWRFLSTPRMWMMCTAYVWWTLVDVIFYIVCTLMARC